MADTCPPVDVLVDLLDLPADDRRRRHLDTCPRCRARLLDYEDFVAGGEPLSDSELAQALVRLDASLREAAGDPGPTPALPRREARAGLALAALLLLAVAVAPLLRDAFDRGASGELRLRGQGAPSALELQPARWTADGALVLSWAPLSGADAYAVRLLGAGLNPLDTREVGAETSLTLDAEALRALLPEGGDYLVWQVEAFAGGDPLATSPPASLALPPPLSRE